LVNSSVYVGICGLVEPGDRVYYALGLLGGCGIIQVCQRLASIRSFEDGEVRPDFVDRKVHTKREIIAEAK